MKIEFFITIFLSLSSFFFLTVDSRGESLQEKTFTQKRQQMIAEQIKARGIKDHAVLRALEDVPRHKFVPLTQRYLSYEDYPLPIGEGQTISQPYIVALMTELMGLKGHEKVLEIGTGSGYQAAVLGEIAQEVYTIEIVEPLANRSSLVLSELGYDNVFVKHGDGFKGWPEHAPYDAIMVTCAPPEIPPALIEQLAEGGRLVIPVGTLFQQLKVVEKNNGQITETSIIPVRFVPMVPGKE